tara:strand:+ start:3666 stop:4319 length:654 start_codon:yes stop_codon:yes gene_type:complete
MFLITEHTDEIEFLKEEKKDGTKDYSIKGVFMQSEVKNRNGRIYPKKVLMDEAKRYMKEYVKPNRAMGELGHPSGPTVNLERVSHLIKELKFEGNDVVGTAKILDTPYGKIVKNLMDEGTKLGVSTRGMGSLEEKDGVKMVKEDFMLSAVDIVADPSAPDAFVDGIMEGKVWVWENGVINERQISSYHDAVRRASSRELEEVKLEVFEKFMSELSKL